jgi:hypothetical protein
LPAEPSSKRVLVWRHLRKLGAISEAGVWILPESPNTLPAMKEIVDEIRDLGGRAIAFTATDLLPDQNEALRSTYNRARREEYEELLVRCQRFLAHIQRLIETGDLKFAALEEMEEDLEKRRHNLAQLVPRDVFGIPERAQVEACIKDGEAALALFAERVYLAR